MTESVNENRKKLIFFNYFYVGKTLFIAFPRWKFRNWPKFLTLNELLNT
jgi:hypothetical protein